MFSVIIVPILPSSSGKWFWHLGGLVLINITAKDTDSIESIEEMRNMRS